MLLRLFLLFVLVPLVELAILLWLAEQISWYMTIALVLTTGLAGSLLARSQGFRVWRRIHEELRSGRMPTDSLLDGVLILVAGALLLTPGILTDAVGLSLLIPPCRALYRRWLIQWFRNRFRLRTTIPQPGSPSDPASSDVIDSQGVTRSEVEEPPSG